MMSVCLEVITAMSLTSATTQKVRNNYILRSRAF